MPAGARRAQEPMVADAEPEGSVITRSQEIHHDRRHVDHLRSQVIAKNAQIGGGEIGVLAQMAITMRNGFISDFCGCNKLSFFHDYDFCPQTWGAHSPPERPVGAPTCFARLKRQMVVRSKNLLRSTNCSKSLAQSVTFIVTHKLLTFEGACTCWRC